LLFLVLFFPRFAGNLSAPAEIQYSLFFRIPAAILLIRLLIAASGADSETPGLVRPRFADLVCFAAALPGLIVIGAVVGFAASFSGLFAESPITIPVNFQGWTAVILTSLTIGYLEEGYFRCYLLTRLGGAGFGAVKSIIIAVLVFSLCHVYEGPWGIINAAAAGVFLSILFIRRKRYHGLALAHGFYNILVFLFTALVAQA
jgi:membrane protease YdiL (CAAX protease family)